MINCHETVSSINFEVRTICKYSILFHFGHRFLSPIIEKFTKLCMDMTTLVYHFIPCICHILHMSKFDIVSSPTVVDSSIEQNVFVYFPIFLFWNMRFLNGIKLHGWNDAPCLG